MTTKDRLLAMLEGKRDVFFSGEDIAKALQVSRAAVWKAVQALRAEGYPIDAVTNKGYRLSRECDILSAQGVMKYLKPEYRSLDVTVLPTADSTHAGRAAWLLPGSRPPDGGGWDGAFSRPPIPAFI